MLLRKEREELLDDRIRNQNIIKVKSPQLKMLANRQAKYLSPQIYESIFSNVQLDAGKHK